MEKIDHATWVAFAGHGRVEFRRNSFVINDGRVLSMVKYFVVMAYGG